VKTVEFSSGPLASLREWLRLSPDISYRVLSHEVDPNAKSHDAILK